ncbi:Dipeptide transport ATP-binding protein DppF (TC 3.A.1.5.2) [Streptococcus macedonicus]|nr:Dipeptide transport ATP-binding protein DppF (TC 3.A.1.5.2) [Streptococcus macedonicus]
MRLEGVSMNISVNNLDFGYPNKNIFDDVNITFTFGNIYLLYGENGSGKSSLSKILAGYYPVSRDSISFPPGISFDDVSLQFQEIRAFKNLKVNELEKLWFNINKEVLPEWQTLRELLDIKKIESKLIKHLSGGENRSLIVYLTMLQNKKVTILDEPLAGMDRIKKDNLTSFLLAQKNKNKLYIVVSHEVKGMENIFSKILVVENKKLLEVENVDELIRSTIYGFTN